MARKQAPSRSDSEWFNLITECRKSGLSDTAWCRVKGIPSGTFFCAVQRLRKKAYSLPERSAVTDTTLDLTSRQDVVRIDIKPKTFPAKIPEPVQPQFLQLLPEHQNHPHEDCTFLLPILKYPKYR